MKNRITIDRIQSLLHKYYEAETTPEEENLLESFFNETPEEEIPETLEDERIVFSSLNRMNPSEEDMEIPADLFDKISSITQSGAETKIKNEKGIWPRRIAYAVGAACAYLLLCMGFQHIPFYNQPEVSIANAKSDAGLNRLEDGYIEINDPEEAEKIMREIGILLASNTQQTNKAIRHLEKTLGEYKELNKSRLQ